MEKNYKMEQPNRVPYYCETCKVIGRSKVSFDEHLASKGHQKRTIVEKKDGREQKRNNQKDGKRPPHFCSLCQFAAPTHKDLLSHRRSEEHRNRLLDRRAEATLRHLGPLFERAQLLLLHADPPIDLKAPGVHVGALVKKLKILGLGFACITCLKEFSSEKKLRRHLLDKSSDIYPLAQIDEEEQRVLQKLEERGADPEVVEQAILVFIVRKALLIKVFAVA